MPRVRKNPSAQEHEKLAKKFYKLAESIRRKKEYVDAFKYAVMARTEAEHGALTLDKYLILEAELYKQLTGKQMWESPYTETSHLETRPKTSKKKVTKKKKRRPKPKTVTDIDSLINPRRRSRRRANPPLKGSSFLNPRSRRNPSALRSRKRRPSMSARRHHFV